MTNEVTRKPWWSDTARSVWGKSSGFDAENWLPLVQHLVDSADVAGYVWTWLPASVRGHVEAGLSDGARDGLAVLRWLAGSHDVGKASPPFAAKMPGLADRMRAHGLVPPGDSTEFAMAPHGLVGHVLLERWMRERYGAGKKAARSYAVVVGGHHGVPPTSGKIRFVTDRGYLLGDERWRAVQDEILDGMAIYSGAEPYIATWAQHRLTPTAQSLLTAAVIVCDWIASNVELFPFDTSDGEKRAELAWQELDLSAPWQPRAVPADVAGQMSRRFPALRAEPRVVQRMAVAAAHAANEPSLMIVEAAMGTGKTEAALMAGEVFAERFGCGGLFFGLPTMATADGLFDRVVAWIETLGDGAASTFLAHGKAGLNDTYRGLFRRKPQIEGVYDDGENHPAAQVESWLTGRKKGVLASMVVGTIDQLLFMALQSKHVVLRHLGMSGKVVIVDEVHAADDFMRMYLCRALEWLAAYGVPVILLSATLPLGQRKELVDAYRAGLGQQPAPLAQTADYPLITTAGAGEVTTSSDKAAAIDVPVEVRWVDDEPETLIGVLDSWLVDGGCVAIIRNTVGRAQETAAALRERFGEDVVLHHSRFLATHRARRERELRAELGRNGDRPHRRIVVGTQVLEQSLDVDFDAMVTDLAPADLVLQRLGRLHRHTRRRPAAMANPQVVVTGVRSWADDGPDVEPGSETVYGLSRLLRAAGAIGLTAHAPTRIALPTDIRSIVEAAYAETPPVPHAWMARARQADAERARAIADARDRADHFRLSSIADLDGDLVNLLEDSTKEAQEEHGAARVRDSEDGIEVLVVQRIGGEVRYVDDDSPYAGTIIPVDVGAVPDDDLGRALAAVSVRLPWVMTTPWAFERTLDDLERQGHEGWQQSRWLAGQLVLHLDADWQAHLGGFDLTYHLDDGLVVQREETK